MNVGEMTSIGNMYYNNDKLQSRVAKHFRNDELLCYTFIIKSAGERIVKIGEYLANLQATGRLFIRPIRIALLSSKMQISPDKLKNVGMTDRNCY